MHGCRTMGGERTVKRLRLSRALTVPESTTVLEVCRRMAARRADAALLTDSNALLCGILTDKVGRGPWPLLFNSCSSPFHKIFSNRPPKPSKVHACRRF